MREQAALTLRVTSHQHQALGPDSVKVFDEQGGTIGRARNNDWVLPDPERFVSGRHAAITYRDGGYYLDDTSTNGVYINDSEQPVGSGNPVRLNDGDQLFIGDYEITVSIEAKDAVRPVPSLGASVHSTTQDPALFNPPLAEPQEDIPVDPLDPLEGAQPAEPNPESREWGDAEPVKPFPESSGAEPNHVPAPGAFFQPPRSEAEQTPEDGDLTDYVPTQGEEPSEIVGPLPEAQTPEPPPAALSPEERPLEEVPMEPPPQALGHPAAPPGESARRPDGPTTFPDGPPSAAQATPPTAPAGQTLGGQELEALQAFLEGAGLDAAIAGSETAPELMKMLGGIFREVVQELMDVLRARTSLKSELRMPLTTIQPVENNPLKFSLGAEDAVYNLLFKKGPGYMPPVDAFQEGFQDLKDHQMAMMVGMQAAFQALLRRFDPKRLEDSFTKGSKPGLLLAGIKKAKYWELYTEFYREVTKEAEDDFQRFFGETFGRAYEEQIYHLSQARKKASDS